MKHILAMLLALLGASGALAQIYVKVVPEKKTFLSGEAMYMRLTITNNSGASQGSCRHERFPQD